MDGDLYGDLEDEGVVACAAPNEWSVLDNTDCDDQDDGVHPEAAETCDGLDNDCDDVFDDDDAATGPAAKTWYADEDGDLYGDIDVEGTEACAAPDDSAVLDHSDDDPLTFPDADEDREDVDRNCDGEVDGDADGDGYSDAGCGGLDCDDDDADVFPLSPLGSCEDSCATILAYRIDRDGHRGLDAPERPGMAVVRNRRRQRVGAVGALALTRDDGAPTIEPCR